MANQGIPIVSLFCGPGGMDLGFRREGFIPILAIDDNEAAIETYNWNDSRNIALKTDIRQLSARQIVELVKRASPGLAPRGVIGGLPCQSFSLGNVRKKKHDPRATLGQEYARVLMTDGHSSDWRGISQAGPWLMATVRSTSIPRGRGVSVY